MDRFRVIELAKQVVKTAHEGVETEPAKSWLRRDERGTWELRAREIVSKHPDIFETHGDKAIEQAANILAVEALEAILRSSN